MDNESEINKYTTQHNTTQHNTTQHNTTQYNTIKLLEYTSPLSLILSDFSFATAFETSVLHISWQ